jgi:hypothetical protein
MNAKHRPVDMPISQVAAWARKVFYQVQGGEVADFETLPPQEQASWQAATRFVLTVANHDSEEDGPPELEQYASPYYQGWMPPSLRGLVQ